MSRLSTLAFHELDEACKPIYEAFGDTPYLVGSSTETSRYGDVDIRLILKDADYDALFKDRPKLWPFLCRMIATYLRTKTGLPVDFQIQRQTEANKRHKKSRNPMGIRSLENYAGGGDATPKK